jgi:multidrug efflux pump
MKKGGLAQYFVEHREVGWLMLVAVLVWGTVAFQHLPQQEDPTIPHRQAELVTKFPGATAVQAEQLVTEALQKRIAELDTVEELKSESRPGVSIIHIKQRPATKQKIDQGWDEIRARIGEVRQPAG